MRRSIRSERVKLPRVHRVTRKGRVYKYHRVTRTELPSDIPEDHPLFIKAWTAEEGKKRNFGDAAPGTITAGCIAYLSSSGYRQLSETYKPVIRRHVEAIRQQGSDAMMRDLEAHHIEEDLDPLTPAVARSRMKAWRKLCAFWKSRKLVLSDVSLGVTGKRMPRSDGHIEWTQKDLHAFRKHYAPGTPERLALELLQWTGARSSDVVRLGPGMVREGLLVFRQVKTGTDAMVPWTGPALGLESERELLLTLLQDCRQMVYLTTVHGRPRSHKAFSGWFSQAATDAGLPHLSAHGLRKYRMNRLAESGATLLQMQTWVGHLTLTEVERYTRRAARKRAFGEQEQSVNPVNQSGKL